MRRALVVAALALAALPADAQLYRHRDPETGQTKLTNVPPPGAKQVVPPAAPAGEAKPPTAPAAGPSAALPPNAFEMDRQRTRLLQQLVTEAPNVGTAAGKQRFFATLGDVVSIETRLDRLDPGSRKGREAERDRALERCSDGFAVALKDPNAQLEFTGELLRFMGERIVQCARGTC